METIIFIVDILVYYSILVASIFFSIIPIYPYLAVHCPILSQYYPNILYLYLKYRCSPVLTYDS